MNKLEKRIARLPLPGTIEIRVLVWAISRRTNRVSIIVYFLIILTFTLLNTQITLGAFDQLKPKAHLWTQVCAQVYLAMFGFGHMVMVQTQVSLLARMCRSAKRCKTIKCSKMRAGFLLKAIALYAVSTGLYFLARAQLFK